MMSRILRSGFFICLGGLLFAEFTESHSEQTSTVTGKVTYQ